MTDLRIDLSDFGVRTGPGSGREEGRGTGPSGPGPEKVRRGRGPGGWVRRGALAVFFAVVPFVLLLRGSVHAWAAWGWPAWGAVAAGVAFAGSALAGSLWLVLRLIRAPGALRRLTLRGGFLLAGAYAVYGLVYVAARHVKADEIRAEYRTLHPLLRLASTTLFLVDRDAVVTDAARARADYGAMGLAPRDRSLHFLQPDGYVHALDLRTRDRHPARNALVEVAFRAMGFRTLRHVGTADHLHIALPPPDRPPDP